MEDADSSTSWEYVAAVKRELRRANMSRQSAARLDVVMARVAARDTRPGDVDHLAGNIYEVRVKGDRREYRLLFAYAQDGTVVALALRFFVKKVQKTPRREIDLATKRHSEWLRSGTLE